MKQRISFWFIFNAHGALIYFKARRPSSRDSQNHNTYIVKKEPNLYSIWKLTGLSSSDSSSDTTFIVENAFFIPKYIISWDAWSPKYILLALSKARKATFCNQIRFPCFLSSIQTTRIINFDQLLTTLLCQENWNRQKFSNWNCFFWTKYIIRVTYKCSDSKIQQLTLFFDVCACLKGNGLTSKRPSR